jgi:hypothetical protein
METGSITRREALRRGAVVGGAVLWASPTVQTLGMGRALAAQPSGGCAYYAVKYDVGQGWGGLGQGRGNCMTVPSGAVDGVPAVMKNVTVSGSAETGLTVTLPAGVTVFDSAETGTPDELTGRSGVWVKCGSMLHVDACDFQSVQPGARSFTVNPCGTGKAISHFEFVIRHCI